MLDLGEEFFIRHTFFAHGPNLTLTYRKLARMLTFWKTNIKGYIKFFLNNNSNSQVESEKSGKKNGLGRRFKTLENVENTSIKKIAERRHLSCTKN